MDAQNDHAPMLHTVIHSFLTQWLKYEIVTETDRDLDKDPGMIA